MKNKYMTKQDRDYLLYLNSEKCAILQHTECIKYFIKECTARPATASVIASKVDENDNVSDSGTSTLSESKVDSDPADEVRALQASIKKMARKVDSIVSAGNKSTELPQSLVEYRPVISGDPI